MTPLLSIHEIAERLSISETLCRRLIAQGKLRAYRIEGAIRCSEEQIEEYLDSSVMQVEAEPGRAPIRLKHIRL
jgi:excisionase family DNA binding protein